MAYYMDSIRHMEEEMIKFEKDIGINSKNVCDNSPNKTKFYDYNFQKCPMDIALSKEIDSLLHNQFASAFVSKMQTKCLTRQNELDNKAHVAIAAAGCASSSNKTHGAKQKQFYRKAGGKYWYDPTMKQWSNDDFRLFVGNLGREVSDHMLSGAFMQYSSFIKARVVKNRDTRMSRGCYGFVSFGNSVDYFKAIKELNGKYIGSRPMKIEKSNWKKRNVVNVK